jgi:hypothetical protein
MKTFNKTATYIFFFLIVLLMGCTKEVEVLDIFDFAFEVRMEQEGYVYESSPLNIKIVPANVVNGTTYKMSFEIVEGASNLETYTQDKMYEGDKHAMDDTNEELLKFIPSELGLNKIIIKIEDSNGVIKTKEISFVAKLAPFTFLFTPNLSTYLINAKGLFTSTLVRKEQDTFTFSYLVENGTGLFYDGDVLIPPGKEWIVKDGVKSLSYVPSTLGTHSISLTATASDNAKINRIVEITVDDIPFLIDATASTTVVNVNQDLVINVDLKNLSKDSNVNYKITHEFLAGGLSGIMVDSKGIELKTGVYAALETGVYSYKFTASKVGLATIFFKVIDNNGQEKFDSVVISVQNIPFSLSGVPTEKTILLNKITDLNFNLSLNGIKGSQYSITYDASSGSGIVSNNTTTLESGKPYKIEEGVFSFKYKPSSLGSHILNFIVTDTNGEARTVIIQMTAINTPVTFNVSSVAKGYVNQIVPLFFTVTPQYSNDTTYKMNYFLSGGTGTLKDGTNEIVSGAYFNVQTGSFKYDFTPKAVGTYVITFELKDSNNQIITKEITLEVLNNHFSFTPTASESTFINEKNLFSYALVPSGEYKDVTYTLSYSVEGSQLGSFFQNETEIQQGIPMTVIPTSFKLKYLPTTVGQHLIHYVITDSNGLVKKIDQTITVISVDFDFIAKQTNTTVFKNTADGLTLSLSQRKANSNIIYSLSYTLTGVGQVLDNGSPLANLSIFKVGNHNYTFVSDKSGTSTVVFNVVDSNGNNHSQTITYITVNTDYSLTTSGDGTLYLGNSKDFNGYLSQVMADPTATYQVRYVQKIGNTGKGKLYNGSDEIPWDIYQPINKGTSTLSLLGTAIGTMNIIMEVKDSNNLVRTSSLGFSVVDVAYTFTGVAQQNTIYQNQSTALNFDITENAVSGTNYQYKYVISSGVAQIKNGATVENANQWYDVSVGNYSRNFEGTTAGEIKMLFTVRNTTTLVEQTKSIVVNVINSVYTFSAAATENNKTTTTPVNVNFNLQQTGGGNETYKMSFVSSGTGTFTYNMMTYSAGQIIPFSAGSSNGTYKGTTAGNHNVNFTAINSNNLQKSANTNITFINNDFSLSTSGDGSLNVNTSRNFNVFVSQNNPDNAITYQIRYDIASSSIGDGTLSIDGAGVDLGTYKTIDLGTNKLVFNGTEGGIVNLEVTVKDSNGITHTSIVAFDVKVISYTFTGTPQQNTIYQNQSTPLNFDITEASESGTNYQYKYVISNGVAQIKNGATVESANQWYDVNIGSFNRNFEGTTAGEIEMLFTVRNTTTLVEQTKSITVNVINSVYTFSAAATENNKTTTTPVNVNFNLQQTGGGAETYTMSFVSNGTGTFLYKGVSYSAGEVIPFSAGASNGTYKGTTAGTHAVTFTAINSNNLQKTATTNITFINNDFSLSTSGDGSLNANTSKNLNIFVSQNNPDNTITYQAKYGLASGSVGEGTLSIAGTAVDLGTYKSIDLGNTSLDFKGTKAGVVNLEVTVKDSNGLFHSSTVVFDVKETEFTFSGATNQNTIYGNENTALTFSLTETASSGSFYEAKFIIQEGDATIKNGNVTEISNQWYDVNTGSFSKTFFPKTVGTVKMMFTVRNKTSLAEKTQLITVNVIPTDFSFSAYPSEDNSTLNKPIMVNFNLQQKGGTGDVYNKSFTTSGSGTFEYKGLKYVAGQNIPFDPDVTFGQYTGTTKGTHNIVFKATNQTGTFKTAAFSLEYLKNDFSLASSGDGSLFYNAEKPFSLWISQTFPDTVTYQVKYSFASPVIGQVYKDGVVVTMGVFNSIPLGSSMFSFKGTNSGNVTLNVEVLSSEGVTKFSQIIFEVKPTEFTLSGSPAKNTIYVNENTDLTFSLAENVPSGSQYEIKFSMNSGNAQIKNGAIVENANQWYNASVGNFTKTFFATVTGTIKVLFTVRNKTSLVEKTELITVNVIPTEFTFSATASAPSALLTKSVPITFDLTQTGGTGDAYKLSYTSSGTGTFTYNGVTYSPGQNIPFVSGTNSGSYTGTTEGTHKIVFTATNQYNTSKTDDVSLNYIRNTFSLSTTGDGTLYVNETKAFSVGVSQTYPDPAVTYQVKYTFSTGVVGELSQSGSPITTGVYYPIVDGNNNYSFKGINDGSVTVNVEVLSSEGVTKTSNVMFTVKPTEFTFTATASATSALLNKSVPITFDLTQTGGTGDVYKLSFTSSGTGTFTYNGTTYTAGQNIPFVSGINSGSYTGTTEGTHKIVFKATNQYNTFKTDDVSLIYIRNTFTLSTTGDGTLFYNETKAFSVGISQTYPDPAVTYQVKYTFDNAVIGEIYQNGNLITTGVTYPISTGTTTMSFKGTNNGSVTINVEVLSSEGVTKTSKVMFTVKPTEFTFTATASQSTYYVNEAAPVNFSLAENVTSSSQYEMMYSVTSGSASLYNGSTTISQGVFENVSLGSFARDLKVFASGNVTVKFTLRNKTSLEEKTATITVTGYQKPTLNNIRTWHIKDGRTGCYNGCNYDYRWLIKWDATLNTGVSLKSVVMNITPNSASAINITLTSFPIWNNSGFISLLFYDRRGGGAPSWDNRTYSLTITDSNDVVTTMNGLLFTDLQTDSQ